VVGVKIADELGYADGLHSPAEVSTFLHTTAVALRAAAPGKLILVDMIVPELGCMPGQQAAAAVGDHLCGPGPRRLPAARADGGRPLPGQR
jgi:hypothetical protein